MTDVFSKAKRSEVMSRIRGKDTKPEMVVRRYLHRAGLRYRVHARDLPGRPDIVLPARGSVVLIHGCFFHRHPGCRFAYNPKSNVEFWQGKFAENVERDRRVEAELRNLGWKVEIIWECEVASEHKLKALSSRLLRRRVRPGR